ncbi:MAG: RNA polymerase sigma factor, partial [Candidatus Uhrbacteria bacterium GW2011_GWD2_52_7]
RRALGTCLLLDAHVEQPTESALHNSKLAKKLARIMAEELTPEQMTTVTLFADGYKYSEIAEQTHVRLGTVMSRLHRARRTIQACANDHFSPDDF